GQFDDPPAHTPSSSSPRSSRRRSNQQTAWPSTDEVTVPANASATPTTSLPPTTASVRRDAYEATYQRRRRPRMPDSPGSHDERDAGPPAAKRRKTDASHDEAWPKPIKYGKYGQEVPGKLRLKIVSCDGGEQQDPRYPALSLGCENILRHDRSVYSSSRPGCNIVLRHEDWTPFCLEKLHIVAPEDGFRYPVGRGIVHVAMNL
ncbi:uncharacterized protein K489DRAFT_297464, partial [Dissoconium aciculare CBS 342.82]|uniref:Uncharacterized protein n=1 Tax=Dissoconium aciculare CBS 342.82 TaxID=1314786 RepID=A0A6J3M8M0_9PEZI